MLLRQARTGWKNIKSKSNSSTIDQIDFKSFKSLNKTIKVFQFLTVILTFSNKNTKN